MKIEKLSVSKNYASSNNLGHQKNKSANSIYLITLIETLPAAKQTNLGLIECPADTAFQCTCALMYHQVFG